MIRDFYADLFGWSFEATGPNPWPTYNIVHPDGAIFAFADEVSEEIRSKFSYWMPCFGLSSTDNTATRIMDAGGSAVTDLPGERAMLVDRQGTYFMVQVIVEPEHRDVAPAPAITTGTAWKSALALICFWGVVFLDIRVFWAVLFLFWSWLALRSGQAYVVKPIDRHTQPMLYWAIAGTLLILSLWLLLVEIARLIPT